MRPAPLGSHGDPVFLICRKSYRYIIPLIDVAGLEARLSHQRRFELGRQFFPPFLRPAQDTQAGCPAQIVFSGRIGLHYHQSKIITSYC